MKAALCLTAFLSFSTAFAVVGHSTLPALGPLPSETLGVRWLKDLGSPSVQQWVATENKKTSDFLKLDSAGAADPFYTLLANRHKELAPNNPPPSVATPLGRLAIKGGGLVLTDATGAAKNLAPKITYPNGSGTSAIVEFKVSPDQSKVAYSYIKNNSDMNNWFVAELSTAKTLVGPILVRRNDFNWSFDSNSFYFTQRAAPADHALGVRYARNFKYDLSTNSQELVFTPPQQDTREFYAIDDLDLNGERYFIANRVQGAAEIPLGIYLGHKATAATGEFQVGNYSYRTIRQPIQNRLGKYIGREGATLFLRSTEVGNGFGVVSIDLANKMKTATVVPARRGQVLIGAQKAKDRLLLQYFSTTDFKWTFEVADLAGTVLKVFKPSDVGIVDIGTASAFTVSEFDNSAQMTFSELRQPPVTFNFDLSGLTMTALTAPALPFSADKIKYKLDYVTSKDGTRVPIEIYTRSDVVTPSFGYLFYYGYIGIANFSSWNRKLQVALELGGAVVICHQRGGGELGRNWQLSVKSNRLPSLEDTVAAANWMRKNLGVTKVLATGRSFGGMHTMQLLVHHADAFDAFVPIASVSDINEFLNEGLFGYYAVDDFGVRRDIDGNPLDAVAWRKRLAEWSPLANLDKMTALKPTMIFTADTDERVGPEQSFYMAEALNKKYPGNSLVHLFMEKNNGHDARTEFVDEAAFIGKTFGISSISPLK